MTKKLVWHDKTTVNLDDYTLDEALSELKGLKEQYPGKARFDKHCYPYEEREYLFLQVEEEETDEEYEARLKQEQKAKEWQEARDKQEFERLKAKFGDKQ